MTGVIQTNNWYGRGYGGTGVGGLWNQDRPHISGLGPPGGRLPTANAYMGSYDPTDWGGALRASARQAETVLKAGKSAYDRIKPGKSAATGGVEESPSGSSRIGSRYGGFGSSVPQQQEPVAGGEDTGIRSHYATNVRERPEPAGAIDANSTLVSSSGGIGTTYGRSGRFTAGRISGMRELGSGVGRIGTGTGKIGTGTGTIRPIRF